MCNARILPKNILLIPPSHLLCFVVHFDFMFALTPSLFLLLFSRSELLEQLKMRKLFNIYLHLTISSDLHFFLYITFVSGVIYLLLEKLPFVVPIAHHSLSLFVFCFESQCQWIQNSRFSGFHHPPSSTLKMLFHYLICIVSDKNFVVIPYICFTVCNMLFLWAAFKIFFYHCFSATLL